MNTKAALALVAAVLLPMSMAKAQQAPRPPQVKPSPNVSVGLLPGKLAPEFAATDTTGKSRRLSEFHGRRVALFFFCGCEVCADVMRTWGQEQQSNSVLQARKGMAAPATIIVYTAEAADVAAAAKRSGLSLVNTVLLPDPEVALSLDRYQVDPCPRIFVLDAAGVIRYTNNHVDDAPQKSDASVIVDKTLTSLRDLSPRPSKPVAVRPR